jgi:hypothetical protein
VDAIVKKMWERLNHHHHPGVEIGDEGKGPQVGAQGHLAKEGHLLWKVDRGRRRRCVSSHFACEQGKAG